MEIGAGSALRLEFFADPAEFLAVAEQHLASDPVINTVVATVAHRAAARGAAGIAAPERDWWMVVRDESDAVRGVAMRTAPSPPYPPFLLPMPDDAALALARALHERGAEISGINGVLPAVEVCAAELARLGGGRVEIARRTRLHRLDGLLAPTPVPGRLDRATEDDLDLALNWFGAFSAAADQQAGRPAGATADEVPSRAEVLRRIQAGLLWFWADGAGRRVHLTGVTAPSFGVARIAPVYTPPAKRGRGWASNAVAEVCRHLQEQGARACLFTDQANPTSNKIYAALGFRPVVDMADLVVVR